MRPRRRSALAQGSNPVDVAHSRHEEILLVVVGAAPENLGGWNWTLTPSMAVGAGYPDTEGTEILHAPLYPLSDTRLRRNAVTICCHMAPCVVQSDPNGFAASVGPS